MQNIDDDKTKQEEMRHFYENSSYYQEHKHNYADTRNIGKTYLINNVFDIYYPNKSEKIIVLGAGWGNISFALQKKGYNVVSIDYSERAIGMCKSTAQRIGLDDSQFFVMDATKTQFNDSSFDVAYCIDLVEHLYPSIYNDLLKEVFRILKKNGKLVIYTPNPSHFFEKLKKNNIILKKDKSHVDYKTMKRLHSSLKRFGFTIKKAYYIESHVPILNFFEKKLMGIFPFFRRRIAVLSVKPEKY